MLALKLVDDPQNHPLSGRLRIAGWFLPDFDLS